MNREQRAALDTAYAEFVRLGTPSLHHTAWLLTGSADAAGELVQAALVKAYVVWPRIHDGQSLAYTRRILVNVHHDSWRRRRREDVAEHVPERPVTPPTVTEDRDELMGLLATLSRHQRTVVVLRYYNDLPEAEVAELLGISVGSVKSAASRGLATLRAAHSDREQAERTLS